MNHWSVFDPNMESKWPKTDGQRTDLETLSHAWVSCGCFDAQMEENPTLGTGTFIKSDTVGCIPFCRAPWHLRPHHGRKACTKYVDFPPTIGLAISRVGVVEAEQRNIREKPHNSFLHQMMRAPKVQFQPPPRSGDGSFNLEP